MIRQRLLFAGMLVAICSIVASSGDADARYGRCRGNYGWRQNYYGQNYYGYTNNYGYNNGYANGGWIQTNGNGYSVSRPDYAAPAMSTEQMPNTAPAPQQSPNTATAQQKAPAPPPAAVAPPEQGGVTNVNSGK